MTAPYTKRRAIDVHVNAIVQKTNYLVAKTVKTSFGQANYVPLKIMMNRKQSDLITQKMQ